MSGRCRGARDRGRSTSTRASTSRTHKHTSELEPEHVAKSSRMMKEEADTEMEQWQDKGELEWKENVPTSIDCPDYTTISTPDKMVGRYIDMVNFMTKPENQENVEKLENVDKNH
jgi:hypothetical protein